ncbi:tail protein X [Tropicimonas sp. IMCC34043]|uniref:tail protein X n=1 Tax=Tropicimonas sp. IMCC34043 TaxID=2248760 RepID=UPI000E27C18C|nr:tail protein X [Tropicimonas sp. IMCC34043]
MTATTHVASEGEALDLICWRHYGYTSGAVEQVLEANQGLRAVAQRLPQGALVILPDLVDAQAEATGLKLWD